MVLQSWNDEFQLARIYRLIFERQPIPVCPVMSGCAGIKHACLRPSCHVGVPFNIVADALAKCPSRIEGGLPPDPPNLGS
jgi:hypothetical protein